MSENEGANDEKEIKVILLGEMGTGKTSLISTAIGKEFQEKLDSTITNSIMTKSMKIEDKIYTINLWDTIGQEKYRSLTKIFIKGAKIVIFVYDITNAQSFKELNFWIESAEELINEKTIMGIVGNKSDLFVKEEVDETQARKFASDKGYEFALTSAKNPALFCGFLENLIKKYLGLEIDDFISNQDNKEQKGKRLSNQKNKKNGKKNCC